MKTIMKIISIILLTSAICFSCGTRNADKNKNIQKNEEKTEQNSNVKKESETTETAKISTENNSESKVFVNIKGYEINKQNELQAKIKNDSETNETKLFISEYYPNGFLKSKTEYSANQSKLLQENSELKKENEYYYSTIIAKQEENKIISVQNSFLEKNVKEKSDSIGSLKKQIENYSLKKLNKTERDSDSFWLYVLIFTAGFCFAHLLKFLWTKFVQSQWYLSLIKNIKNI